MSLAEIESERSLNPVDLIEQVATVNQWEFERFTDDEINLSVTGVWTDYSVSFSWIEDFEALHLACAFDQKVSEGRTAETIRLLSLINEQMLIGHFDLWAKEGTVMFRQALLLNGGAEPTDSQLECMLASALDSCERYYQAFQFVVWAGHSADEAISAALFETHGNA